MSIRDGAFISADFPRFNDCQLPAQRTEGKTNSRPLLAGPFVKEGTGSPAASPLLHRAQVTPRAVQRSQPPGADAVDAPRQPPGKLIIRAAKSPERAGSPEPARPGAYVNVQGACEGKRASGPAAGRRAEPRAPRRRQPHPLCPARLRPSGGTPKLLRRPPPAEPGKENSEAAANGAARPGRRLARSESYRMANSPIMFIKKLSGGGPAARERIVRTASEELREELLRERINYPESVAGPEPPAEPAQPPAPRPADLEPARVLSCSGADAEVW